jgi:hypothetical protein
MILLLIYRKVFFVVTTPGRVSELTQSHLEMVLPQIPRSSSCQNVKNSAPDSFHNDSIQERVRSFPAQVFFSQVRSRVSGWDYFPCSRTRESSVNSRELRTRSLTTSATGTKTREPGDRP